MAKHKLYIKGDLNQNNLNNNKPFELKEKWKKKKSQDRKRKFKGSFFKLNFFIKTLNLKKK